MSTKMQLAHVWLVHDDKGSNVQKKDVTPAEAHYLNAVRRRHKDDKEPKVIHIHDVTEVERTILEEKERLANMYGETDKDTGKRKLDEVFPGSIPSGMPMTFKEAGFVVENEGKGSKPKKQEKLLFYPDLAKEPKLEPKLVSDPQVATLAAEVAKLTALVTELSKPKK